MEGPVAVSIAVSKSMRFYSGGVFNDADCGFGLEAKLTHAVVAIGWGTDTEFGDYWIIKNSWSNAWGQDGYIFISMDKDLCGVTTKATWFDFELPPRPKVEEKFQFNGTFSLPYANITQEISIWYDKVN